MASVQERAQELRGQIKGIGSFPPPRLGEFDLYLERNGGTEQHVAELIAAIIRTGDENAIRILLENFAKNDEQKAWLWDLTQENSRPIRENYQFTAAHTEVGGEPKQKELLVHFGHSLHPEDSVG